MSFGEYLGAKAVSLCAAGIGLLYSVLIAYFCKIPLSLTAILLFCVILMIAVWEVIGWRRADRRLRQLRSRLESLPEKYLIGETIDRPRDAVELQYYLLMKEISRSAIGAVEQARADRQDYCDYVEQWVHEIKTPLTACSLILSNGGEPSKLRRELRRADNLTETILTYAKLRTAEKEIQISKASLGDVCGRAVREEMELLIAAGIVVSIDGDGVVYTDPKLLIFILKQLLINCAKYCPGCKIQIGLSEDGIVFEDNGPGIPSQELKRVTERGFTGSAGRGNAPCSAHSTGMGLYIVSQLCQKMNIEIGLSSKEGQFTRFTFRFPAKALQNCKTAARHS